MANGTETISVKKIEINGKPLPTGYAQSSLTYKLGLGDVKVRTGVNGNTTTRIVSEDRETQKSMAKFDIFPIDRSDETDARAYVTNLRANLLNTITVLSSNGKTIRFTGMILITDPEFGDNPDGVIPLSFEGNPAQIS